MWGVRIRQICLVVQLVALIVWAASSLLDEVARLILLWRPKSRPNEQADQPN